MALRTIRQRLALRAGCRTSVSLFTICSVLVTRSFGERARMRVSTASLLSRLNPFDSPVQRADCEDTQRHNLDAGTNFASTPRIQKQSVQYFASKRGGAIREAIKAAGSANAHPEVGGARRVRASSRDSNNMPKGVRRDPHYV
jgi:hypothetical protein